MTQSLRSMFTTEELNKLDCMNYMVYVPEGHYYITTGREGLASYATREGLAYWTLMRDLLDKGQVVVDKQRNITMV